MSIQYIQQRQEVLLSRQDRIQEMREKIRGCRGSERVLMTMETELLQEIQEADGIASELGAMEMEDPMAFQKARQMEKRLAEVHMLLAERDIYTIYTAAVTIQLLTGETMSIGIHMNQEMRTLPYEFVGQLGMTSP